jgi:integrase
VAVTKRHADALAEATEAAAMIRRLLAAVERGELEEGGERGRLEAPFFEADVVDAIAASVVAPYDLLVRMLGILGPRWAEGIGLRRRSVDVLRRRLIIDASLREVGGEITVAGTKSHAVRQVAIPPSLLAALEAHMDERVEPEPDALLFTAPAGGPLRHSNFDKRMWRPALTRLGLPSVGLHVLRHSAAARMIAAGYTPKAVQMALGHASVAFTLDVYGHLFDSDLDELAARLDGPGPAKVARGG